MKNIFCLALITLFSFQMSFAQDLDEEIGFIYVKAEYLYETGRYSEAIEQYDLVISQNPNYKDAMAHRGQAKLAMGAYGEAKGDALASIERHGIQSESAALLARSFAADHNYNAAVNSMTAAISLDVNNPELYELRAGFYESAGQKMSACQDYEIAAKLGSTQAASKVRNICGGTVPTTKNPDYSNTANTPKQPPRQNTQVDNDNRNYDTQDSGQNSEYDVDSDEDSFHQPEVKRPSDDNTVNTFVLDDDLTIEISGQELGLRKVIEVPSILILSDERGEVVIDFCVNAAGQVTTAEFNGSRSTIAKKSMVSLAISKAKDFEFAQGEYESQCGIMVFKISGM